jgi:hypothetical protein
MNVAAHPLVAKTAREMAAELFEELCRRNEFYRLNVNRGKFLAKMAPKLLEEARTTLAQTLAQTSSDVLKEQIAEALILDNSLKRNGKRPRSFA